MAFLRFTRDKRGYEHFYLVQPTTNRRGKVRTRILYWFRTPPERQSRPQPFDDALRRALERRSRHRRSTGRRSSTHPFRRLTPRSGANGDARNVPSEWRARRGPRRKRPRVSPRPRKTSRPPTNRRPKRRARIFRMSAQHNLTSSNSNGNSNSSGDGDADADAAAVRIGRRKPSRSNLPRRSTRRPARHAGIARTAVIRLRAGVAAIAVALSSGSADDGPGRTCSA